MVCVFFHTHDATKRGEKRPTTVMADPTHHLTSHIELTSTSASHHLCGAKEPCIGQGQLLKPGYWMPAPGHC
jgi:hypothetical protein